MGSDYMGDMVKVHPDDIKQSHMTLLAPVGKRHDVIMGYAELLENGFDLGAFEINGTFNDSISVVRFLKKYMPVKKEQGTEIANYVYINIPEKDNKYYVVRHDASSCRVYDIHVDLIVNYTLGKYMYVDAICFRFLQVDLINSVSILYSHE